MSAIQGRRTRRDVTALAVLQARVQPAVRTKAHEVADALGVSMATYIERLIEHDQLDAFGRPSWWPEEELDDRLPDAHEEGLPLANSA